MLIITSLLDANSTTARSSRFARREAAGEDANSARRNRDYGRQRTTSGSSTTRCIKTTRRFRICRRLLSYVMYGDSLTTDRAAKNGAKFLMGVSHYFIATIMIHGRSGAEELRRRQAASGRSGERDNLSCQLVARRIPTWCKQLMPAVAQLSATVDQMIKVYCAPPKGAPGKKP